MMVIKNGFVGVVGDLEAFVGVGCVCCAHGVRTVEVGCLVCSRQLGEAGMCGGLVHNFWGVSRLRLSGEFEGSV